MEKILDNGFEHDWKWIIGDRGELLWHDKPSVNFSISWLEFNTRSGSFGGPMIGVVLFWVIIFFYVMATFDSDSKIYCFIVSFVAILLPFIGDLFHYYKVEKTEYAITKDYVYFKLFNGWKYIIHPISMSEIISVNLVGGENERGTLHIITADKVGFMTYNSQNYKRRDHPTLEYVKNSEVAYELINQRIKNNPPRRVIYKEPVISSLGLQLFQFFLSMVIIGLVFIIVLDYGMPLINSGAAIGSSIFIYLFSLTSFVFSLIYTFKDKEFKMDTLLPIIAINFWIVLISVIIFAILNQ